MASRRAAEVAAAFRSLTGRVPDGVWAAPGRVNLLGEHTDYNDGLVLPVAVDRSAVVAARRRPDGLVRCRSLDRPGSASIRVVDLRPGRVGGWPAYVFGVVWALVSAGVPVGGLDLVVASDVPLGAGLSSSAALECAVALAASDLAGSSLSRRALAAAARRAEVEMVGAPVGIMDQTASLQAEAGCALLLDCRSLAVTPVPLELAERGLALLVIDTRVAHAHASGLYGARRAACEAAARELDVPALRDASLEAVTAGLDGEMMRRARHVVTEIARVPPAADALARGDTGELGMLFAASHASMREDFEISCAELDTAVEASLAGGAVAARMTGGGFGGCAVALAPAAAVSSVTAAVVAAFAAAGFATPHVFPVHPAGPAAQVS